MMQVLVLDEADMAAIEVVAVLKSLLADGTMRLSDGRRVLSPELAAAERAALAVGGGELGGADLTEAEKTAAGNVLTIHPNFCVGIQTHERLLLLLPRWRCRLRAVDSRFSSQ